MAGKARHGWRGDPPGSEAEARERIVGAAMRCVDRYGPEKTGLSDVAHELGVTRQTVYRYFAGTDDLLAAVARSAADSYLDGLDGIGDPGQMPREAVEVAIGGRPGHRGQQVVDAGEVPVHGLPGHAQLAGDIRQARLAGPVAVDAAHRRADDTLTGLGFAAWRVAAPAVTGLASHGGPPPSPTGRFSSNHTLNA